MSPRRLLQLSSYLCRNSNGSVMPIAALAVVAMFGSAGLAIDFSRSFSTKQTMQNALDAAVLAALQSTNADDTSDIVERVFNANSHAPSLKNLVITSTRPAADTVEASVTADMDTTLSRVLGQAGMAIAVNSRAKLGGTPGRVCVLVLDPSAPQSLLVNSGANVAAPDCEIHVRSTASPAAIFNSGSSLVTKKICIEGSTIIDNGGAHNNLTKSCTTSADPYAGALPTPNAAGCDYSNLNFNGGSVTLKPGRYCGWINFNAATNVVFSPGVYVIQGGGWNVDGGNWSGSDVTFYYADTSKIQFNSAVAANMQAPTSGAYAGIFMFEAPNLPKSPFVLDDSRGFNVTDLIYLPSSDTIFNSASNLAAKKFTLVVNTLILDDTNWQLEPGDKAIGGTAGGTPALVR